MTSASPILRALTLYMLSLPVAIVLGYALATPLDLSNLGIFMFVAFILALPMLLRLHHPLLLLAWIFIMDHKIRQGPESVADLEAAAQRRRTGWLSVAAEHAAPGGASLTEPHDAGQAP